MALAANVFSTAHAGTTSTGTLLANNLPFTATRWELRNYGTVPVRFSLASTSPSTDDAELKAEEERVVDVQSSKFSVMTTSTSTEGADHRRVAVYASG